MLGDWHLDRRDPWYTLAKQLPSLRVAAIERKTNDVARLASKPWRKLRCIQTFHTAVYRRKKGPHLLGRVFDTQAHV